MVLFRLANLTTGTVQCFLLIFICSLDSGRGTVVVNFFHCVFLFVLHVLARARMVQAPVTKKLCAVAFNFA